MLVLLVWQRFTWTVGTCGFLKPAPFEKSLRLLNHCSKRAGYKHTQIQQILKTWTSTWQKVRVGGGGQGPRGASYPRDALIKHLCSMLCWPKLTLQFANDLSITEWPDTRVILIVGQHISLRNTMVCLQTPVQKLFVLWIHMVNITKYMCIFFNQLKRKVCVLEHMLWHTAQRWCICFAWNKVEPKALVVHKSFVALPRC